MATAATLHTVTTNSEAFPLARREVVAALAVVADAVATAMVAAVVVAGCVTCSGAWAGGILSCHIVRCIHESQCRLQSSCSAHVRYICKLAFELCRGLRLASLAAWQLLMQQWRAGMLAAYRCIVPDRLWKLCVDNTMSPALPCQRAAMSPRWRMVLPAFMRYTGVLLIPSAIAWFAVQDYGYGGYQQGGYQGGHDGGYGGGYGGPRGEDQNVLAQQVPCSARVHTCFFCAVSLHRGNSTRDPSTRHLSRSANGLASRSACAASHRCSADTPPPPF